MEHIYHEANCAVDFMASLVHNLAFDLHMYCSYPVDLGSFLSNDSEGLLFLVSLFSAPCVRDIIVLVSN